MDEIKKDHSVGAGTGAAAGAGAGALAGAALGPIGSAIGAVIGGIVGAKAGDEIAEEVNPTEYDAHWQREYQNASYYDDKYNWDDYAPAYGLGYHGKKGYRSQPFVEAAIALGASDRRVLLRHILPQLLPVLAMIFVLDFGTVMLAEAGLSFLGLGVQPPDASWGSMVADGREFVTAGAWWFFLTPGVAIFLTVFAANLTSRWAQELLGVTPHH